ncbi:triose-phosphate isomerase [Candidatus Peregrinibacteria bacterium]|nr:triose-phosphate isomerase [Candidatus Peregrinibacteria bacterium]
MKLPIIVTNFKAYDGASGEKALELALIHEKVAKETGVNIAIAVQALDLWNIASRVSIPVFAQHVDPVQYGAFTGSVVPEAVKVAGAFGTLLNHSEKRLSFDMLRLSIERANQAGLFVIVCAATPEEGSNFLSYQPDFIAVEPPELIGGDVSVSSAQPHIITKAVELVGENRLLVGAGVKNAQDVRIAVELGASGVLLASGVTKAKNPEFVLQDLVSGLQY